MFPGRCSESADPSHPISAGRVSLVKGVFWDTDVCIRHMRMGALSVPVPKCAMISWVTLAELETGVSKCDDPRRERQRLSILLRVVRVRAFGRRQARCYGRLRAGLERSGLRIGTMDMLIAAHALSLGLPLATRNRREFGRVPGLDLA